MSGTSKWWCEGCDGFFLTTLYNGLCYHCHSKRFEREAREKENRMVLMRKQLERLERENKETKERVDKLDDRTLKIELQIQQEKTKQEQEKTKQTDKMIELAKVMAQLKSDFELHIKDDLTKKDKIINQLRNQLKAKNETFSEQYSEEEGNVYTLKQSNQNLPAALVTKRTRAPLHF